MSTLSRGWTAIDEAKSWQRIEEETRLMRAAPEQADEDDPPALWTRSAQAAQFLTGLEGLAAREACLTRPLSAESENDILESYRAPEKSTEAIDHPSHYHAESGLEVIEIIEAWGLNFNRGNALKYLARAGAKDPEREAEDLKKALWYIKRELQRLEGED